MAKTIASMTIVRTVNAVHLRQALTCTSLFSANQITHASAGASSSK